MASKEAIVVFGLMPTPQLVFPSRSSSIYAAALASEPDDIADWC